MQDFVGVEKVRACVDKEKYGLIGLEITQNGVPKKYGTFSKDPTEITEWEFNDEYPMIGLYGYQKEKANKYVKIIR